MPESAASFSAVVSGLTDLTHDVRSLTLQLEDPGGIVFQPGQFVSFQIQRPSEKYATTRAYTIVSSPDAAGEIELLLNLVPGGPGSEYLFTLHPGDRTRFRGPFGTFVVTPGTTELLLVANDTGIAPFLSMLRWLVEHEPERTTTLVWALKGRNDLYYKEELERLSARMPNLTSVVLLAEPDPAWTGPIGVVQPVVEERIRSVANLTAFLCGSTSMIRDVRDLLRAKGPCQIYREPYYNDVQRATASGAQ